MSEYKVKEGMIDNRMVHDTHQEGIKRVMQKKHDPKDYCGHNGSMAGGWNHGKGGKHSSFKRSGESLTPRKG